MDGPELAASGGAPRPPLVHRFTDVVVERGGTWRIAQVRAYVFIAAPSDGLDGAP